MRTEIEHEWCWEISDENGDITDNQYCDSQYYENGISPRPTTEPNETAELVLVRSEGNNEDGLTDRVWAYPKNGQMPVYFSDDRGVPTKILVPKKYITQYIKYSQSL